MSDRYFLDTNVFVYCFERKDGEKQRIADQLVAQALEDHLGVISSQVAQEFLSVATRKFPTTMTTAEARDYLDNVLAPLCEVFPSFTLFKQALGVREETGFSFYDSLIVAAASEANCRTLFSEDLHPGQTVRGVTIENPFATQAKGKRSTG